MSHSSVLPPDVCQFESVIIAALCENNEIRRAAEKAFTQCKLEQPEAYVNALILILNSQQKPKETREFCAVMLRQAFTKPLLTPIITTTTTTTNTHHHQQQQQQQSSGAVYPINEEMNGDSVSKSSAKDVWSRLSSKCRSDVESVLLQLFDVELIVSLRRKIVSVIGAVSGQTLSSGEWPEFFPTFLKSLHSPHELHRESVLDIINNLAEFVDVAVLKPHLHTFKLVLIEGLKCRQNQQIQLSALKALISILLSLTPNEQVDLQDTIPLMFSTLHQAYLQQDDEVIQSSAVIISQIVREEATFLRPHLKPIIAMMLELVQNTTLEEETRRISLEFLITLVESGKGMVRKLNEFAKQVIPLSFTLLLELEHTEAWDRAVGIEDDDDGEENFKMGEESVGRLALALGGKIYLTVATPIINAFIHNQSKWNYRFAALTALACMAETIDKNLSPELSNLLQLVIPLTNDPHPRVQWGAINCLAQFAVSFSPSIQENHHEEILLALCSVLTNHHHPRVICHACTGIVEFANELDQDILSQYADRLLHAVIHLISIPSLEVQQKLLGVISSIAIVLRDKFIPYYHQFYPGVKHILCNASSKEQSTLRSRAIECIGTMAEAVGPALFGSEANEIMKIFISIQQSELPADDLQLSYLIAAEARIARCLKQDFRPYLPYVIPPLLKSGAITDEYAILPEDDDSGFENREGYIVQVIPIRGGGNAKFALNTQLFEEKCLAVNMLCRYAEELKEVYLPFVDETAKIIIPLLSYTRHEMVRMAAVSACPALITCASLGLADRPEQRQQYLTPLFDAMFKAYLDSMKTERAVGYVDNLISTLDALTDTITALPFPMTDQQIVAFSEALKEMTEQCLQRRKKVCELRNSADYDEEEEENIQENLENEEEFLGYVFSCLEALITTNTFSFLPHYHNILHPLFLEMLNSEDDSEITIGICVISQLINDLDPLPQPLQQTYCDALFPVCMRNGRSLNKDVRQSSCFAIGAVAKQLGNQFQPVIAPAIELLLAVIEDKDSREEENNPATDGAVSALGKICLHCSSLLPSSGDRSLIALQQSWLSYLPCRGDHAEAILVHQQLLNYIENEERGILGENWQQIPRIIAVFGAVLDSELINEDETLKVERLLKQWHSTLYNAEEWRLIMEQLDAEDQESVNNALQKP